MNVIIEGPIPILFLDKNNKNNRIYPVEEVEKALKNIKAKELLGICELTDSADIDLSKASFTTSIPYIKEGILWIDHINQLTTPQGVAFVEALKKPGLEICFRPIGTGVIEGNKVVDYNIVGMQMIPKQIDSFS